MKIIVNAARCRKCHTYIESKHVHDFVWCKCKNIAVDGGKDYLKRSAVHMADFEDLSITEKEEDKTHKYVFDVELHSPTVTMEKFEYETVIEKALMDFCAGFGMDYSYIMKEVKSNE